MARDEKKETITGGFNRYKTGENKRILSLPRIFHFIVIIYKFSTIQTFLLLLVLA